MNKKLKRALNIVIFSIFAMTSVATLAQNKVVVVPLGGAEKNTGQNQGDVVGYVVVRGSDGSVVSSWMASGETPTVSNPSTGRYDITWPGENFSIVGSNAMSAQATIYSSNPFFIALDSAGGNTVVWTDNASGANAAPFGFTVTLFQN